MFRRSIRTTLALVVAFGLGAFVSNEIASVNAQPAANALPHGKCIGISSAPHGNGGITYSRIFEDGTAEYSQNAQKWQPFAK
jgi:hypothetical protein